MLPSAVLRAARPVTSVPLIDPSPVRTFRSPEISSRLTLPSSVSRSTLPVMRRTLIDPSPLRATSVVLIGADTTRLALGELRNPPVVSGDGFGTSTVMAFPACVAFTLMQVDGRLIGSALLDFDPHLVPVPAADLDRSVPCLQRDLRLAGDGEGLLLAHRCTPARPSSRRTPPRLPPRAPARTPADTAAADCFRIHAPRCDWTDRTGWMFRNGPGTGARRCRSRPPTCGCRESPGPRPRRAR